MREGLSEEQQLLYSGLRDFFLGNPLFMDAVMARLGKSSYDLAEILAVAEKYGVFDHRYDEERSDAARGAEAL